MRARDRGLGACGRINLIDKTLIKPLNAIAKKAKFNTKSITYSESTSYNGDSFRDFAYFSLRFYGRMFDYLSFCKVTKSALTLTINY